MFEIIKSQHTPKLPSMKKPVEWIEKNEELLNDFLTFAKTQDAVGLASNQVQFKDARIQDRFIAIKIQDEWMIAVNPRIRKHIGKSTTKLEGCLTWGNAKLIVAERSHNVDIDFYTIGGEYTKSRITDEYEAQVWQHEINHIEGVKENLIDRTPVGSITRGHGKIGRNEPCPCGSGKKYKKCHYGSNISQFF
jgi:peptide deformylase